jgi:hypothetical protein
MIKPYLWNKTIPSFAVSQIYWALKTGIVANSYSELEEIINSYSSNSL